MDIFLLVLGFLCMCLGLLGSFLPILPGPLTSWLGLLLIHFTDAIPMNRSFLIITFLVAFAIWILDYFIPALGTKKFGGTKYGVYGTTIGLFVGLFLIPLPLGFVIGAFLGAFIGELLHNSKDKNRALKASYGAIIGFFASTSIKFLVSAVYFYLFFSKSWMVVKELF